MDHVLTLEGFKFFSHFDVFPGILFNEVVLWGPLGDLHAHDVEVERDDHLGVVGGREPGGQDGQVRQVKLANLEK